MKCSDDISKTFETAYLYLSFKNQILLTKETDTKMLKVVDILKICFENKKIRNSCWKISPVYVLGSWSQMSITALPRKKIKNQTLCSSKRPVAIKTVV